ncbi:ferredoxin--NADP reductase [Reichenbachiella agarivorans]|uniref:Ferredoxin--NADP reductase n=1 Tax=Reichenbachiella agarivorans TaxID=2979464 RepID=A0ABY6CMX9_9BACT|nr:ferredoxin--NADP reductase [Reichenbachiella agarivorans]UXP31862.1 ferredoxin--NADP reductase [Reichenbachiella agarivorans]
MERISNLKVIKVVKETPDAISIYFKQPIFWKLKYSAGQYLTVLVSIDGTIERRCFSLNSAPEIERDISITVKNVQDGKVSSHLFHSVKEGDKIKVLHPQGEFKITPDPEIKRHIMLFGGGSGIAPLMSILKTILNLEPKSMVSLFYGNRDEESIIYNEELKDIKFDYQDRLNLIYILEDPGSNKECYKGRVERNQIPQLLKLVPKFPFGYTYCYVCGPTGMMIEAMEGLKLAGVPVSNIYVERYAAQSNIGDTQTGGVLVQNREIKLLYEGKESRVTVKASKSILDAALDHGVRIPFVCKDGICGSCKATCLSGKVYMREGNVLTDEEIDQNMILSCISAPISNNVVIKVLD